MQDWNDIWTPKDSFDLAVINCFMTQSLWTRKAFQAALGEEGFDPEEWFERGYHRDEDKNKVPIYPWKNFRLKEPENGIPANIWHVRRRPSWKIEPATTEVDDTESNPQIMACKKGISACQVLRDICNDLPYDVRRVVQGNSERLQDRLRHLLDRAKKTIEIA